MCSTLLAKFYWEPLSSRSRSSNRVCCCSDTISVVVVVVWDRWSSGILRLSPPTAGPRSQTFIPFPHNYLPHPCRATGRFCHLNPPQGTGRGAPISKGEWTLPLPSCRLSLSLAVAEASLCHGKRPVVPFFKKKEAETVSSGFPLLIDHLDCVVKTVTHPSTGQTQLCLTSVISRELVCQRGWDTAPCFFFLFGLFWGVGGWGLGRAT